jgi:hypothetical protein
VDKYAGGSPDDSSNETARTEVSATQFQKFSRRRRQIID